MKLLCYATMIIMTSVAFADPVIINNNPAAPQQLPQQAVGPQQVEAPPPIPNCNANQNNIYDPRVPPAGVYHVKTGRGSSETNYTTGEKKPYIVDNNCNQGGNAPIQPQLYVQPPIPEPIPLRPLSRR